MQVSEIYLSYVDNTYISKIVLTHFKPMFSISTPFENIRIPEVFWSFQGYKIKMVHCIKLGY